MKSNTSILILNALQFLIKLALKNRKRINEIRNLCNMSAFILRMLLIYVTSMHLCYPWLAWLV